MIQENQIHKIKREKAERLLRFFANKAVDKLLERLDTLAEDQFFELETRDLGLKIKMEITDYRSEEPFNKDGIQDFRKLDNILEYTEKGTKQLNQLYEKRNNQWKDSSQVYATSD